MGPFGQRLQTRYRSAQTQFTNPPDQPVQLGISGVIKVFEQGFGTAAWSVLARSLCCLSRAGRGLAGAVLVAFIELRDYQTVENRFALFPRDRSNGFAAFAQVAAAPAIAEIHYVAIRTDFAQINFVDFIGIGLLRPKPGFANQFHSCCGLVGCRHVTSLLHPG